MSSPWKGLVKSRMGLGLDQREINEDYMGSAIAKKWGKAGVLAMIVLLVAIVATLVLRKPALHLDVPGAREISPPVMVPQFHLMDQHEQVFNNDSLKGNWTLAVIGYTYCPDVCPTTLMEMSHLFKQFTSPPNNLKAPRFVFFSVDPFRDTVDVLREYVGYFNAEFLGVTGKPENIYQLVSGLGLFYIYEDPQGVFIRDVLHKPPFANYSVVHYSGLLFISPQGKLLATLMPPLEEKDILAVMERLHVYYGE